MNDYKPWEKLKAMFPTAPGKYNFSDNDAISMMVLTRELLEKSKKADKFAVLNLFCNWTVHTELEGSKAAYKILAAVTDIFLSTSDLVKREHLISQELSSAQLRQEIIKLYTIYGISTHIFKSAATWKMFGQHFFKAILGKRLRYPPNPTSNPKASSIYNAVISKAGSRIGEVALTLRLQTGFPGMEYRIFWIVECLDGHEEKGEYKNLERDPDFSNPSFWEGKVAYVKSPDD
jgi:hypothetical protein